MDVLFLAIDGVLNSHNSYLYWSRHKDKMLKSVVAENLCFIAINNLNCLIESCKNPIEIVITSELASFKDLDFFKSYLAEFGFLYPERLIGITPRKSKNEKDWGIKKWLKFHSYDEYVILDSYAIFSSTLESKVVTTDIFVGLSVKNVLEALVILNRGDLTDLGLLI